MKARKHKKKRVKSDKDIKKKSENEAERQSEEEPQKGSHEKETTDKATINKTEEEPQGAPKKKPQEGSHEKKATEKAAINKTEEEPQEAPKKKPQEGSYEKKATEKAAINKTEEEPQEAPEKKPQEGSHEKEAIEKTEEKPQEEIKHKQKKEKENITESDQERTKKRGKAKWVVLVFTVVLVLALGLTTGYVFVAKSYSTRFLPASQINGIDCSDMNAAEASARVTPSMDEYVLEVKGRDFATGESGVLLGRITASDVDMHYEGILNFVENALEQQNEYRWIFSYLTDTPTSYSVTMTMTYDEEKAKSFVQTWNAFQAENMRESQEAYISEYSEKTNSYQVIPRTVSTRINAEQAYQYIIEALHNYGTMLDLEALGCYEEAAAQENKKLNETVNTANRWLSAEVTYDWNGSKVVVDKQQLREWISIVEDEPVLDTEQVRRFVKKQASAYDTYGKTGSFTTVHNVKMDLYHASYGWKTDIDAETEELIKLIQEGSTVNREPSYSIMARQKGTNDIGDSYVEVDLTHQHLYLHNDGQIVLETDFVSGDMLAGNATPQGIFGVTYKQLDAVLRGTGYVTPVKYWMPFYGNYGMHDATWRSAFGGNIYIYNGSHGCINLPLDKAAGIYQYVSKGFPVICYYYTVDPLAGQEMPLTDSNPGEGTNPDTGQGNAEGTNAGADQGNAEGQNLGADQENAEGTNAGAGQGNAEGQNPGAGQGNAEGINPEAGQENAEGTNPGADQGNAEGHNPGTNQGNIDGQNSGAGQNNSEEHNSGETSNNDEGQNLDAE